MYITATVFFNTAGAYDTAAVKIYLISSLNRVIFSFVNTVSQVEDHRSFVSIYNIASNHCKYINLPYTYPIYLSLPQKNQTSKNKKVL